MSLLSLFKSTSSKIGFVVIAVLASQFASAQQVEVGFSEPSVKSELASQHVSQVSLKAVSGFTGTVKLVLDTTEVDKVDLKDAVEMKLSKDEVALADDTPVKLDMTLTVGSLAPSATDLKVMLKVLDAATSSEIGKAEMTLTVNPLVKIRIYGAGDKGWFIGGKSFADQFDRNKGAPTINFLPHAAGLKVVFENYMKASDAIHSSGTIPHQNTGTPMGASPDGVQLGGTYEPAAIMPANPSSSTVYLQNTENGGLGRKLNFNVK